MRLRFHRSSVRSLPLVLSLALVVSTGLLVAAATDLGATSLPAIGAEGLHVTTALGPGVPLAAKPCDERLGLPPCDPVTCDGNCRAAGFPGGICALNCCICLL